MNYIQCDQVANENRERARKTIGELLHLLPSADKSSVDWCVSLVVDELPVDIRVKRASTTANQINAWRGEVVCIHAVERGGWIVLSPEDQLKLAQGKEGQHGTVPLDTVARSVKALAAEFGIIRDAAKLREKLEEATRLSRDPVIVVAIRLVNRARRMMGEFSQETLTDILSLRGSQ